MMGAGTLISDLDLGLAPMAGRSDGLARPAAIVPKGWCPSLFDPMAAGDGLLARVKPRIGGLSGAELRAVADAAARYGSGRIEITNRANLQIRGLLPETAPLFAAAVVAAGLASLDPAAEARRNIVLPPRPTRSLLALAAALEHWLETDGALVGLPAKFGFAVDEGTPDLDRPQADITLALFESGVAIGLAGDPRRFVCDQPVAIAQALTHAFLALAPAQAKPPRRMAALVALVGADAVWAHACVRPAMDRANAPTSPSREWAGVAGFPECNDQAPPDGPPSGLPAWRRDLSGHLPRNGEDDGVATRALSVASPAAEPEGLELALPFGAADSTMLVAAADLAERFGDGTLRVTTTRRLVLTGIANNPAIRGAAAAAGFITNPGDPRLRIAACAGQPACPSGWADVRDHAALLALSIGLETLHVSGCAKGCAHPGPAAMTLVATPGGYDLVRNGRAGSPPERAGLTLAQVEALLAERPTASS